jgi:hypothetical protein
MQYGHNRRIPAPAEVNQRFGDQPAGGYKAWRDLMPSPSRQKRGTTSFMLH